MTKSKVIPIKKAEEHKLVGDMIKEVYGNEATEIEFKKNEKKIPVVSYIYKKEPIQAKIPDLSNDFGKRNLLHSLKTFKGMCDGSSTGEFRFNEILSYLISGMPVRKKEWHPDVYIKIIQFNDNGKRGMCLVQFVDDMFFSYSCDLFADMNSTWELWSKK